MLTLRGRPAPAGSACRPATRRAVPPLQRRDLAPGAPRGRRQPLAHLNGARSGRPRRPSRRTTAGACRSSRKRNGRRRERERPERARAPRLSPASCAASDCSACSPLEAYATASRKNALGATSEVAQVVVQQVTRREHPPDGIDAPVRGIEMLEPPDLASTCAGPRSRSACGSCGQPHARRATPACTRHSPRSRAWRAAGGHRSAGTPTFSPRTR